MEKGPVAGFESRYSSLLEQGENVSMSDGNTGGWSVVVVAVAVVVMKVSLEMMSMRKLVYFVVETIVLLQGWDAISVPVHLFEYEIVAAVAAAVVAEEKVHIVGIGVTDTSWMLETCLLVLKLQTWNVQLLVTCLVCACGRL